MGSSGAIDADARVAGVVAKRCEGAVVSDAVGGGVSALTVRAAPRADAEAVDEADGCGRVGAGENVRVVEILYKRGDVVPEGEIVRRRGLAIETERLWASWAGKRAVGVVPGLAGGHDFEDGVEFVGKDHHGGDDGGGHDGGAHGGGARESFDGRATRDALSSCAPYISCTDCIKNKTRRDATMHALCVVPWMLVASGVCPGPAATFQKWTPCVTDDGNYIIGATYAPSTSFSTPPELASTMPELEEIHPLPTSTTVDDSPCDCGGLGRNFSWKVEDDTSFDGRRCRRPRFSWSWSTISAENTEPDVGTVPPGGPREVKVTGRSAQFLTSPTNELGQPCGVVTQDVLQGEPQDGSDDFQLGPSSMPASLYCTPRDDPFWTAAATGGAGATTSSGTVELGGGSEWERGWQDFELGLMTRVDAVCRCSMGPFAGMFELSGVFFSTPNLDAVIASGDVPTFASTDVLASRGLNASGAWSGWTPRSVYEGPFYFYCREDYVLYWQLVTAARAVFGTGALSDIYTDTIRPLARTDETASAYWRTYYAAGVDCQRKIVDLPTVCPTYVVALFTRPPFFCACVACLFFAPPCLRACVACLLCARAVNVCVRAPLTCVCAGATRPTRLFSTRATRSDWTSGKRLP